MKYLLTFLIFFISIVAFGQDEFKLDENYSISKTGTIKLSSDDARVLIKGSDRSDVHVNIYRKVTRKGLGSGDDNFDVIIEEQENDLIIRDKQRSGSNWTIGYSSEEYEITIEAPKTVSLDINGDDDDYEIEGISGNITMNIDDGDIELNYCTGNRFQFDIDDGDLYMDEGAGELYLDMDDGDAEIKDGDFEKIDVVLDDADLILFTTLYNDGRYRFRANDGLIDLNIIEGGGEIDIRHDDADIDTDGDFTLLTQDDDQTKLKLQGGEAEVDIRADDARIRLRN